MIDTEILSQIPLFASLNTTHLQEIASKLKSRNYHGGDVVFHQGDPGSVLYIIESGQVKFTTVNQHGEEVLLSILSDHDFFGELSLLDGKDRSATATAITDIRTFNLVKDDFMDIVDRNHEIAKDILVALAGELRRLSFMVEDAFFLDLPARLAKRLIELSQKYGVATEKGVVINIQLSQQDLASAVGASRVAVNKQLGFYQDMGIIDIARKRITILRPDELKKRI